ncbi:MAG: VWA domain-containing protein [Planctomycetes bacterium]|nr:VWA domain-containing protein [Planctomycetota bacterium]
MTGLPRWLEALLGIGPDAVAPGATPHFRFARFPEGARGLLAAILVAAVLAAAIWIYRRERVKAPLRRIVLTALRCLLLAAAVAVLLDPIVEIDRVRRIPAHTLVLVDASLSMGLRDRYATQTERGARLAKAAGQAPERAPELTRAQIADGILRNKELRLLERLAERNRVGVFAFADRIEPLLTLPRAGEKEPPEEGAPGSPPPPPLPAIEPRGTVTDLGGALRTAADRFAGSPVAGIVLLSDGRATAGEDVAGAARILARRGIPVIAVGVGDPTPIGNRRVETIVASERIFVGDPVAIEARVSARGGGDQATVEFRAKGPTDEAPRVVERRTVSLEEGGEGTVLRFEDRPGAIGRRLYSVWIEPAPDEIVTADNERTVPVEVVEERSRVLLIAGGPSYEYRFLKTLLKRDDRIELSAWLESADPEFPQEGDKRIEKLPAEAEEIAAYEVVILCDPDASGFPEGLAGLLEKFAGEQGGGIFFIAGEKFTLGFLRDPRTASILDLLPVEIDWGAAEQEIGVGRYYTRAWPIAVTQAGLAHAALRFDADPDRSRAIWDSLEGVYWSFPVRGPKPAATVLATHPDPSLGTSEGPRILLASQFYGAGRIVFAGFDETWRWQTLAEAAYRRYWAQWIRHLAEGRLVGGRRALISSDRETYSLGDRILVSARVLDESWRPLAEPAVQATVTGPGGAAETIVLDADPNRPGWFRGGFDARSPGLYGIALGEASRAVEVELPNLEFEEPSLDVAALLAIAQGSGGAVYAGDAIGTIPEAIPDRTQSVVASEEPITLWDRPFTLAVLAGLLIAEWIIRKWSRLL